MNDIVKLDKLDQKILLVLLKNARVSGVELAKLVNNNYPTVRNRLNKLVENGVIKAFKTNILYPKAGIQPLMAYITTKNITSENEEKLIKELCQNTFLTQVIKLEGKWNYAVRILTENKKDQTAVINQIQSLFGENLKDILVLISTTVKHANREFFSDLKVDVENMKTGYFPKMKENLPIYYPQNKLDLSVDEIKILNYIANNARASLEEIGEAVNIESSLVDYKIKKMINENLIRYFLIDVDPEVLGYESYSLFLNFRGNSEAREKVVKYLCDVKGAVHFFYYISYWETSLTFCVKDREQMHNIFKNLLDKFPDLIKDHELCWIVKSYKYDPYPDLTKFYKKE